MPWPETSVNLLPLSQMACNGGVVGGIFLYKNLNIGEYLNLLITFSGRWVKVLGEGCVLRGPLFPSTSYDRHLFFVSLLG